MIRFYAGCALIILFSLALGSAALAETGIASWYGTESGSRTANGERFTGRNMTCAHRTARFGSRLKVTDLKTGRSIVCRCNDRGPYVRGRIIDLTYGAAVKLGIVGRGVAMVEVRRPGGLPSFPSGLPHPSEVPESRRAVSHGFPP